MQTHYNPFSPFHQKSRFQTSLSHNINVTEHFLKLNAFICINNVKSNILQKKTLLENVRPMGERNF